MSPSLRNGSPQHSGLKFPGVQITEVEQGPVVSRVSTNVRFRIGSEAGLPAGLSANLCVKGYYAEPTARRAGLPETYFYRELGDTGIRTLRSVYAEIDPETQHSALITEDVVAQGAVFLDGTSDYTPEQTAMSLTELAKLHAATWRASSLAEVPWLMPRMVHTLQARGVPEIAANFDCDIGAGVPDRVRDAQRLLDAYRVLSAEVAGTADWTVIHGDTHIGNVYLDGSGRPSWLDWQLVQRGAWWVDVGYHIASALTVEDRRANERDLLRHYLSELSARGIEVGTWDEAWSAIQRGLVHGFFLWGITMRVHPTITTSLLNRLGTAADDHGSIDALLRS